MPKDLFIIDSRCHLNRSIEKAFVAKGYEVEVGSGMSRFFRTYLGTKV
jgi:hypothetical protein